MLTSKYTVLPLCTQDDGYKGNSFPRSTLVLKCTFLILEFETNMYVCTGRTCNLHPKHEGPAA